MTSSARGSEGRCPSRNEATLRTPQPLRARGQFAAALLPPQAHSLRHPEACNRAGREDLQNGNKAVLAVCSHPTFSGAMLLFSPHCKASAHSRFSFDERSAKEKLTKENAVFVGSAHARSLLKKRGQNFHTKSEAKNLPSAPAASCGYTP